MFLHCNNKLHLTVQLTELFLLQWIFAIQKCNQLALHIKESRNRSQQTAAETLCSLLHLQALNGKRSLSRHSISVRMVLLCPMTRETLSTASRSAVRREQQKKEHRTGSQLIQTGGQLQSKPVSPEICTTAGQEHQSPPQPLKIYLKKSKEAKPHVQLLKTPHQKPVETAQTLLHLLRGGRRRNTEPVPKPSAPTGTWRRTQQQLRTTTLNRSPSTPLLFQQSRHQS